MAHQAHNIPWNVLASQFRQASENKCQNGASNLHPRYAPGMGGQIRYFVKAFARTIEDHSRYERRKYPAESGSVPPKSTDEAVTSRMANRMSRTVWRWRSFHSRYNSVDPWAHVGGADLGTENGHASGPNAAIPMRERKAEAFVRRRHRNDCFKFFEENAAGFFNLELVKTMMLYGEMEALLRICQRPSIDLASWYYLGKCFDADAFDVGWDCIHRLALKAYLVLNILYCFPEMWDDECGRTDQSDYRRTKTYQLMLKECTMSGRTSDIPTYPHRQFFGVADEQFRNGSSSGVILDQKRWGYLTVRGDYPWGLMSIDEFLVCETADPGYLPHESDIPYVRCMLTALGLPSEVTILIMEYADYEPKRRLKMHDPFHPDNREALQQYLKYCWLLIVRCNVLARELRMDLDWENEITECILELWHEKTCTHGSLSAVLQTAQDGTS